MSKHAVRTDMHQVRRELSLWQITTDGGNILVEPRQRGMGVRFRSDPGPVLQHHLIFFIIALGRGGSCAPVSPVHRVTSGLFGSATFFEERLRYVIHDNDSKYGTHFARAMGRVEILNTPVRALKANAVFGVDAWIMFSF